MNSWLEILTAVSSAATAVGVFLAACQIWYSRRHEVTEFEDGLAREYRKLASRLPLHALLGQPLAEEVVKAVLQDFYHYFDLTNEQVFLRINGRISRRTWINWRDGIRTNLTRPAFQRAWELISAKPNEDFAELRELIRVGFNGDPRGWRNPIWRFLLRRYP